MKNNLAVIDTNILVSSLIGGTGYSRKIFDDLIVTGKIKMCVSTAVFTEYREVLQRERFKKYPAFAEASAILLDRVKKVAYGSTHKRLLIYLTIKTTINSLS